MAYLLYIDELGTRSRWHAGGTPLVEKSFLRLEKLLSKTLAGAVWPGLIRGAFEGDSLVLVFQSFAAALAMARTLFRNAHEHGKGRPCFQPSDHMWLRGTILECTDCESLRREESVKGSDNRVQVLRLSSTLLDAIAVEKSGFKGMRLLVPRALAQRYQCTVTLEAGTRIRPYFRLPSSMYPTRVADTVTDYLWMLAAGREEWERIHALAQHRIHRAASNPEELAHAAATLILFAATGDKVFRDSRDHAQRAAAIAKPVVPRRA